MIPRALNFQAADEYVAADAQWLLERGIEPTAERAEIARHHWHAEQKAKLRRAGVRIPGEKQRPWPKFTGIKYRYG